MGNRIAQPISKEHSSFQLPSTISRSVQNIQQICRPQKDSRKSKNTQSFPSTSSNLSYMHVASRECVESTMSVDRSTGNVFNCQRSAVINQTKSEQSDGNSRSGTSNASLLSPAFYGSENQTDLHFAVSADEPHLQKDTVSITAQQNGETFHRKSFRKDSSPVGLLLPSGCASPGNCQQLAESQMGKSDFVNLKLRNNVIGRCYRTEQCNFDTNVTATLGTRNNVSCSTSDQVAHQPLEGNSFKVGKSYSVTKEDGKVFEGVYDGKYIVVTEAARSTSGIATNTASSTSETCISPCQAIGDVKRAPQEMLNDSISSLTKCHVKLDRLSNTPNKRFKSHHDSLKPKCSEATGVVCCSNEEKLTPSRRNKHRQRRNLQSSPVTVINIDNDDSDGFDSNITSLSSKESNPESDLSNVEKEADVVLARLAVNTAKFKGTSWHSATALFFQQKISLSSETGSSLTLTLQDITSIKFNMSSASNNFSYIKIGVKPSFKTECLPSAPNSEFNSSLVLFAYVSSTEIDSLMTAIQILRSLLPETGEAASPTGAHNSSRAATDTDYHGDDINDDDDDDGISRVTVECRAPLHPGGRVTDSQNHSASSALEALHEYDCCDQDSESTEREERTYVKCFEDIDMSNGFTGDIQKLFVYPPPPAVGGITVTNGDLFCLNDGEFLNDVIIEFYIKYLQTEILTPAERSRTHIFNTFFYGQLTKDSKDTSSGMSIRQRRHSQVKRWTKHVDLFSKDFIIIPINEDSHWFLAIICFPHLVGTKTLKKCQKQQTASSTDFSDENKNPCILLFDSLKGGSNRWTVAVILREYLQEEWDLKKAPVEGVRWFEKSSMKGASPACPQQLNSSDCGIYLLHYIESFFKRPLRDFTLPIRYLNQWFPRSEVEKKRSQIRCLIVKLMRQLNPSLDYNPAADGCDVE